MSQPSQSQSLQDQDRLTLNWPHLGDKLMDLPHDLAVKALLLEETCDLRRQFGEKCLVIGTRKRQTG